MEGRLLEMKGEKLWKFLEGLNLKFFSQQFWISSLRRNSLDIVLCSIKPVCPCSTLTQLKRKVHELCKQKLL